VPPYFVVLEHQLEQIFFMIAWGDRCSQLPYLHTADLLLHSELDRPIIF
jgi:hypothetical protein